MVMKKVFKFGCLGTFFISGLLFIIGLIGLFGVLLLHFSLEVFQKEEQSVK